MGSRGRSFGLTALVSAAACAAPYAEDDDDAPPDDFELDGDLPIVLCAGDSDAHANLNAFWFAFWFAFESQYGLFDVRLRGGDWHALGLEACAAIGDGQGLDDDALFDVLIEQYRADDGTNYAGMGVPVDVPIAFDPEAFAAGTDVMLDAAIALFAE
ncbi:MAG TPA: hypothetical protein VFG69_00050 [Nannocystaceae bacterium]|nr:hypothetical protein [Nannocystaceae bacterium]